MKRLLLLPALLISAISLSATEFLRDTFTDTDGTLIINHTAEVGGAWRGFATGSDEWMNVYCGKILNNRLTTHGGNWGSYVKSDATPTSSEYSITVVVRFLSYHENARAIVMGRFDGNMGYEMQFTAWGVVCGRRNPWDANTYVNMGDANFPGAPLNLNQNYSLRFEIKNDSKKVYLDNQLVMTSVAHNGITAAGSILYCNSYHPSDEGLHIDSISASDFGPSAPTISNISNQSATSGQATGAIGFTVDDPDTAAASLTLDKASSNTTLIPLSGIAFGGSGTSRTVTITPASGQTGTATLTVTVSDGALTASDSFDVTVSAAPSAPVFTTHPSSQTVTEGSTATFTAAAIGNPTPTYTWKKGSTTISGATSASYSIPSVTSSDAGTYTAVAHNSEGDTTSSGAVLTVNSPSAGGGAGGSGDDYVVYIDPDAAHPPTSPSRFEVSRGANTATPEKLFTVLGSGFVGVGNPTPVSRLVVSGDGGSTTAILRVERSAGSNDRVDLGHDFLQHYDNSNSASALLLNPMGGNVGIGTTNPTRKLDVNGDVNVGANLVVNSTLNFGSALSLGSGYSLKSSAAVELVRILETGNIGIGLSAPGKKLEVLGEVTSRNSANAGGQAFSMQAAAEGGVLWVNAAYDPAAVGTGWTRVMTLKPSSGFVGIGTTDADNFGRVTIQQTGTGFGSHGLIVTTGTPFEGLALSDSGAASYKMLQSYGGNLAINPQGNSVGIGTTSPSASLDVAGRVHAGTGTENVSDTTNGLSVQDSSGGAVAVAVGQTKANSVAMKWNPSFGGQLYTYNNSTPLRISGSSLSFGVAGGDAVIVTAGGNLGVGTTDPTAKLAVAGSAIIQGTLSANTAGEPAAALTLGSATGGNNALRFASHQGNWWSLSNVAGGFSIGREPYGGGSRQELLSFDSTDVAQFGAKIQVPGLNVQNQRIENVPAPTISTDAANKNYVDINTPFKWESAVVSLKNPTNRVGLGTATPAAPFHVANQNFDGEIARFTPWSETNLPVLTRSYISLYNYNPDCRWEFSSQDENGGGTDNGFALRSKHQLASVPTDRFYINPAQTNYNLPSIFRFFNQNPSFAWDMQIDSSNGLLLHSTMTENGSFTTSHAGLYLDVLGNAALGTTNPGGYKLAVAGNIHAYEIVVETGWSDYVFADDYKLMPLAEVEEHIKVHKHLPGVPSAKEVAQNGVNVGKMESTLLAKVEELTLHLIEQEKRIQKLEAENAALRTR